MTHTTVTAAEMKALEKAANDNGLLYIQMMENAGRAAFAQLRRHLPGPARLLVAAGRGNNGGDGWVAAEALHSRGWPPNRAGRCRCCWLRASRKRPTLSPILDHYAICP